MKRSLCLFFLAASLAVAHADISLPRQPTFYDKLGQGIANVVFSPSEIMVSHYTLLQTDGGTVAFCKGMCVQGPSRMIMDIGNGLFDIITAPFPIANLVDVPQPPQTVQTTQTTTQTRRVYRTRRVYDSSSDEKNMGGHYHTVGYYENVPVTVVNRSTDSASSSGSYSKQTATTTTTGSTTVTTTQTSTVETPFWGTYGSMKMRPYDSMVVNEYPPADLTDWY